MVGCLGVACFLDHVAVVVWLGVGVLFENCIVDASILIFLLIVVCFVLVCLVTSY